MLEGGNLSKTNYTSVRSNNKNNNKNSNNKNNNNNEEIVMIEDEEKESDLEAADDEGEESKMIDKEPKKKRECKFCKGKTHTEKFCWNRYPLKAPPGNKEKEKEELMKKYDWAREVVMATERKEYFRPIKEAIKDEEERLKRREKNKRIKCPNCQRWGHELKDCWLFQLG